MNIKKLYQFSNFKTNLKVGKPRIQNGAPHPCKNKTKKNRIFLSKDMIIDYVTC